MAAGEKVEMDPESENVDLAVKGPSYMNVEGKTSERSGVAFMEIVFTQPCHVIEVQFKNYYTWRLTMKAKRNQSCDDARWKRLIPDMVLMPNPHYEGGSQDEFHVQRSSGNGDWDDIGRLLLILRQPSSSWKTFRVERVSVRCKKTVDDAVVQ